jgi:hypothetical protein
MSETCRDVQITMIYDRGLIIFGWLIFCGFACSTANVAKNPVDTKFEKKQIENMSTEANSENFSDVTLGAKLSRSERAIVINYSVTNGSNSDIYVLDALPGVDHDTKSAYVELNQFYLCFRKPATALVLRGLLPLPAMPVNVRVMPLGTKLEPKAVLEREFTIPLPLRERNDWYYPPLPPEEYDDSTIDKILFRLQYMRSTVDKFHAEAAPYAPDFFIVDSSSFEAQTETLQTEFPIGKTQLLMRRDAFPRL